MKKRTISMCMAVVFIFSLIVIPALAQTAKAGGTSIFQVNLTAGESNEFLWLAQQEEKKPEGMIKKPEATEPKKEQPPEGEEEEEEEEEEEPSLRPSKC
ncbi:MAG: hypothetical protein JRG73_12585 [Deltaproteobacteria bacterium]|nr:hypothetical protein [Deltaproteobacteria bacterium]MBW2307758.1 hypothetical protein [Deltaproteobacteria bacterium]